MASNTSGPSARTFGPLPAGREPVTDPLARHAAAPLTDAGLCGHKIDAILTATALSPTTMLISNSGDLASLCGTLVTVIKI
ncbi:hypothetical protein [Streptomyces sp. NPDC058751]|uniref:hypothetical protein n=1 Tax=Streptomyces sp. NPDC058751 TaxID=3346623 RepID=UPI0036B1B525